MNKSFLILSLLLISLTAYSAERDVNKAWCSSIGGNIEFRTKDGTYVDCLTSEYAIEAEYDNKWKEGIGQALITSLLRVKEAYFLLEPTLRPKSLF